MDDTSDVSQTTPFWNSTSLLVEIVKDDKDNIFYERLYSFKTEYFLILRIIIYIIGWVGNTINIRTFLKMGLEDSVTIVFFNLALADISFINASFVQLIAWLIEYTPHHILLAFKVKPRALASFVHNVFRFIFLHATVYLTTFLAIQRCLCVIRPLHFSGIFTRYRTFIVVVCIWVFSLSVSVTVLGYMFLTEEHVPYYNSTWIVVAYSDYWGAYVRILGLAEGLVQGFCQSAVVICIIIMARALAKSVQFRQTASNSATSTPAQKGDNNEKSKPNEKSSSSKSGITSSKERRVIVQVSIVATVFIIANFQRLILEVLLHIPSVSDYFFTTLDNNFNRFDYYIEISALPELVSASVNFFVYYKYNTKFRQMCFK